MSTRNKDGNTKQVTAFYNSIFVKYCELKSRPHFQTDMIEKHNMLMMVGADLSGKDLLDVGCGLGFHVAEYASRGANTYAIDLIEKHVEHASTIAPGTKFRVGDFLQHDFGGQQFDIVTASLVVNHFDLAEKAQFFSKVHSLLRTSGAFFFSDKNPVVEGLDFVAGQEEGFLEVWKIHGGGNGYFSEDKKKIKSYFSSDMVKYYMSFQACIGLVHNSGFTIRGYSDCFPDERSANIFPEEYAYFSIIPQFFIFKICKEL
jgi:2-polyprenyl-3-methyl-5-hydroxy-6-metoxy-1,4-benzoquinol methylase